MLMVKKPVVPTIVIPPVLIEAVKSKRVVPFLGAGASKEARNAAGKQPPDANQLRDILAMKFFGKPMPNRDVMAVAEMAISISGGTVVRPRYRGTASAQQFYRWRS
jgi:hypothetical protein